jgi:hypothetical protein
VCLTGLTGVEPLSGSYSVSPAGTGLTGGAHRSDRCWSVDSRFGVPLRSRVGRVCVLVPRSSGTPVATWAWPTWVVSRRRVLEAVFMTLEFPSPPRRIFISSHSLPLSGSPYRSFKHLQKLELRTKILESKWFPGILGHKINHKDAQDIHPSFPQ